MPQLFLAFLHCLLFGLEMESGMEPNGIHYLWTLLLRYHGSRNVA